MIWSAHQTKPLPAPAFNHIRTHIHFHPIYPQPNQILCIQLPHNRPGSTLPASTSTRPTYAFGSTQVTLVPTYFRPHPITSSSIRCINQILSIQLPHNRLGSTLPPSTSTRRTCAFGSTQVTLVPTYCRPHPITSSSIRCINQILCIQLPHNRLGSTLPPPTSTRRTYAFTSTPSRTYIHLCKVVWIWRHLHPSGSGDEDLEAAKCGSSRVKWVGGCPHNQPIIISLANNHHLTS
jgi:hypothetical protein